MMQTFAIGDIHGCLDQLLALLHSSELTDRSGHWVARDAHLWFLGDFTDRGPDGMGVIDLVMRLQKEAVFEGGFVGALLGNHDLVLQEVYHFGNHPVPGFQREGRNIGFIDMWMKNGGKIFDLERAKAIGYLKDAGFEGRLINLKGGITAWSNDVDPTVPKY